MQRNILKKYISCFILRKENITQIFKALHAFAQCFQKKMNLQNLTQFDLMGTKRNIFIRFCIIHNKPFEKKNF